MKKEKSAHDAELSPTYFLQPARPRSSQHVAALIILNSPIRSFECFRQLYEHADCTVCADGGANRLYDLITEKFSDHAFDTALSKYPPTVVHGDLDSIRGDVRRAYADINVPITQDPDQYSTDFQKALKKIDELLPKVTDILVLGSTGGRVDQGIGLLHELYREQCHRRPHLRFWLFSEASVSTLLMPGHSKLQTPLADGIIGRNIGLLPIYGSATISTSGLEWDVEEWPTSMGGNVSTSNHIMNDVIEVTTDRELLFTVELVDGSH